MTDQVLPFGIAIETWKIIVSIAGTALGLSTGFLAYILAKNEATWQNRRDGWKERLEFFEKTATKEHDERIAKEQQVELLRQQIVDLRDQKTEILKKICWRHKARYLSFKATL